MITIDGSLGEGGGQVLRTALTLSVVTGRAVRLTNIRAGRKKPGLKHQHLACVRAAALISNARVDGAELSSTRLTFEPGEVVAGTHSIRVGTAGSVTLVAQTVLPALLPSSSGQGRASECARHGGVQARVHIEGGTHVPLAPVFEHLQLAYASALRAMGSEIDVVMHRPGFAPEGGGRIEVIAAGRAPRPFARDERGRLVRTKLVVYGAPAVVDELRASLRVDDVELHPRGRALVYVLEHEGGVEVFSTLDKRAAGLVSEAQRFLDAGVPVGEHLADQLLLPLALGAGGSFVTTAPTLHATTNADVIRRFLDVDIVFERDGARTRAVISGTSRGTP